jgi:hypothetical protein
MSKKINRIGIFLMFLVIVIIGIYLYLRQNKLENNHRYSIGTVTHFEAQRGSFGVDFKYKISDIEYNEGSTVNFKYSNIIGKRFYIKYYPSNPKNSEILLDLPVCDSIKEAPLNGWDKLPE